MKLTLRDQYLELDYQDLMTTMGGGAGIIWTIVGGVYGYYAGEATASCRQNPNQWHCVRF